MASGLSRTKWLGKDSRLESSSNGASLNVTLSYEGKKPEEEILTTQPALLRLLWQGTSPNNRLYYGDNLPILATLLDDSTIRGKIRLVYIDPPYATKSVFQSRSLNDAYSDLLSGAHYLEFIRERLVLLRELMSEDGSIYVHLDENMAFHVKIIMDEVFGGNNFRNWITRKKCNPKNYTRKTFGKISDYILFYTKSKEYIWNRAVERWSDEHAKREYTYIEENTGRRYKRVPIHAPGERHGETGKPWRNMLPPPGKHWQYTPARLDEMNAKGEIYWSPNGNPRRKIYLDESNGIPAQDIWLGFRDAHNQNIEITGYPTEKNPALIKRIIEASSNPGDVVLDCFSGSGTTMEVAASLGRRWIGIDSSREAMATILKRFAFGTEPMGDFVSKRSASNATKSKSIPLFRITDFSLYSAVSSAAELGDNLTEWKAWVE